MAARRGVSPAGKFWEGDLIRMLGRIAVELGLQVFMRCNGEDVKWYGEIKRGEQFYIRTAQNIKV